MCFLGRYFLLIWWRLHKGGDASVASGASSIFACLNFAAMAAGGAVASPASVAHPQSVLSLSEGDIVAELCELVVCALDKGQTHTSEELHGEDSTPRLGDGTAVTLNMWCTLTSGKGGAFRQHSEVQVTYIDPSGTHLIIQLKSSHPEKPSMQLQSNPHPFTFRDLQASVSFDMLLGLGAPSAAQSSDLEYSRMDPTAGDSCLNHSEMINMFKVLVDEACDPTYRAQLLREFSTNAQYQIIPAPPSGQNRLHENVYLARCLTHQLLHVDLNEFVQTDPVRLSCLPYPASCQ